jgi:hypothetical protein
LIEGQVLGVGDYPGYTLEVPITWSVNGPFVVKPVPGVLGLSVWDVGRVPRDPCHWQASLVDPGPTVDDLVDALTTQRLRHATEPTDVRLGGFRGRYLEWSVPADMVVTGDADFEGCDVEPSNGHRDFVSWVGNGYGERFQQVAGQVDMLWVLDVDGQRLLVDATYSPDITEADRAELMRIVESLRFVHGWPGARGGPAGLYSWDVRHDSWMHNPNDASIGVSITFSASANDYESGPTAAVVAGYDGTYQELPISADGIRTELWIVDIEGTRVTITVEAQPSTTAAELAEAHAIIGSIRSEPTEGGAGFRLIFMSPGGWDSG